MSDTKAKVKAPKVNHETKAFWEATAEGKLMIGKCSGCNEHHFYPRPLCPFCFGDAGLVQSSGKGKIYSFSVTSHPKEPYTIAYVTLAEGPTMLTNIVESDFDKLAIGQDVELVLYDTGEGNAMPMFKTV